MLQDGLCFDSKSVNHLPERYEPGYCFRLRKAFDNRRRS